MKKLSCFSLLLALVLLVGCSSNPQIDELEFGEPTGEEHAEITRMVYEVSPTPTELPKPTVEVISYSDYIKEHPVTPMPTEVEATPTPEPTATEVPTEVTVTEAMGKFEVDLSNKDGVCKFIVNYCKHGMEDYDLSLYVDDVDEFKKKFKSFKGIAVTVRNIEGDDYMITDGISTLFYTIDVRSGSIYSVVASPIGNDDDM